MFFSDEVGLLAVEQVQVGLFVLLSSLFEQTEKVALVAKSSVGDSVQSLDATWCDVHGASLQGYRRELVQTLLSRVMNFTYGSS